MGLRSNIAKYRNCSVKELSRRANIPYSTLYAIVKGNARFPNINVVDSLCNCLNCSFRALTDMTEKEYLTMTNKLNRRFHYTDRKYYTSKVLKLKNNKK